ERRPGHAGALGPRTGPARRRAARHVTDDVRAAVLAARAVLLGEVRVERDALRARRRIRPELAARVAIDGAVRRLAEALSVTLLGRVFDDTVPAHGLERRSGGGRHRTTRATARYRARVAAAGARPYGPLLRRPVRCVRLNLASRAFD